MVGIEYSNTHINTTTHPNTLALKHLLVAPKPPISITNPCLAARRLLPREVLICSVYCRNCKMQAGLSRLQCPSQTNPSPSLLMLLFNKCYLINHIIHMRLPGFPLPPLFLLKHCRKNLTGLSLPKASQPQGC